MPDSVGGGSFELTIPGVRVSLWKVIALKLESARR